MMWVGLQEPHRAYLNMLGKRRIKLHGLKVDAKNSIEVIGKNIIENSTKCA